MQILNVERMDQLGVIAGVIKDLKLIEKIDKRLGEEELEEISTGEALAGMVLSGLGFSDSPMSLTPQFFEDKPLEILFREGVKAEHFNRFKLGRSLDKVFAYGCDTLFSEIALEVSESEGIDTSTGHLDTSSFSLSGKYLPDSDEQEIHITHGYSKDKRSDLKQALLELIVSPDGGVPLISKSWSGNESDSKIFQKRLTALADEISKGEVPPMIVADSKLYSQDNASFLRKIPFVTRIPGTLKLCKQAIDQALLSEDWEDLSTGYRGYSLALSHYGVEQYWFVIYSDEANHRAQKSLKKKSQKEKEKIQKQIKKLQSKAFACHEDALKAVKEVQKKWKYHEVKSFDSYEKKRYEKAGKPTDETSIKAIEWKLKIDFQPNEEVIEYQIATESCFVLGSAWTEEGYSMEKTLTTYKDQNLVERGFRFLKDHKFFVSSLFLKKPSRIEGLLMVMSVALLVYSIAERRLRLALSEQNETLPNQIKQPTSTPTLRWVFQLLRGINRVTVQLGDNIQVAFQGITELRMKILKLMGASVFELYSISENQVCSM